MSDSRQIFYLFLLLISLSSFPLFHFQPIFSPKTNPYRNSFPGFDSAVRLHTITKDDLAPYDRIIFIGDIHGMNTHLQSLLSKVSYDPSRDFLVHLGDIITKGPQSLDVLEWFSQQNITGVRGNHDQKVVEWRAWIEWIQSHNKGEEWLDDLEKNYSRGIDSSKGKKLKWPIPNGWEPEFMEEHYMLARNLTSTQHEYLQSLPLILHFPSFHTFAVHAGMLPFDPKYSQKASKQPLAHVPNAHPNSTSHLRTIQELALLTEIRPNTNPETLQNIRSVTHVGGISRNLHEGTPWMHFWNEAMKRCSGYDSFASQSPEFVKGTTLPCLPISIVYGHTAARGLDVRRWSVGLDTACVKGHRLTAMLLAVSNLGRSLFRDLEDIDEELTFGDNGDKAQIMSIPCTK